MIELARKALADLGLARADAALACNASARRRFVFEFFVDRATFYQFEISADRTLDAQHRVMQLASAAYPGTLPAPLGLVERSSGQALVTSAS